MSKRPGVVYSHPGDVLETATPWLPAEELLTGGAAPGVVINLCRERGYLSQGWYVSLVAEGRGCQVLPDVHTLEGLADPHSRTRALREAGVDAIDPGELARRAAELAQPPAVPIAAAGGLRAAGPDELAEIWILLGRCGAEGFRRLAGRVFQAWPAPILRARLLKEGGRWRLYDLEAQGPEALDAAGRAALADALDRPLPKPGAADEAPLPSLAVLIDPADPFIASSPETIDRLERVAARRGLRVERLGPDGLEQLAEHDALLIRTVTGVDQPAWRFAARAEALDMPVIDHPSAILRCSNKVFLHELLTRAGLPTPPTICFGAGADFASLTATLGSPLVVKVPDGSFSTAVFRIDSPEAFKARIPGLLAHSPLLVAQAWTPTDYDWRVAVLGGRVLFTCRYYMARGHWQIRAAAGSRARYGRVEAVPRQRAPRAVTRAALDAAALIGDGLFGVDLKLLPEGPVIIEVNDNPNLDIGHEDAADGERIYEEITDWFLRRLEARGARAAPPPERRAPRVDDLAPLRRPVGRVPPPREYAAWSVVGLELEYPIVDRDLNVVHLAEPALAALAGRPTSDVELGLLGVSNEIVDHVIELKTTAPLADLRRVEEVLYEGVGRLSALLAARFGARLLPGGMHPWFDPTRARLWQRSNQRIYRTYERLFDLKTHGWVNVQASHVNLPLGSDAEGAAMMNAAALLVPYLPALAASSPLYDGELQGSVDGRLGWILEHQARLPESCGALVPEYTESLAAYRRDVLGPMYRAVDALPDAGALRHEWLNARGAVFKFSRQSMEVRILDVQECVKMDVAIAWFVRRALRHLARGLERGRIAPPPHAVLVEDFRAVVRGGTAATVRAPHLAGPGGGEQRAGQALQGLLEAVSRRLPAGEEEYRDLVAGVLARGSLSERIAAALAPHLEDDQGFTEAARGIWIQLAACLVENRPWEGRGL